MPESKQPFSTAELLKLRANGVRVGIPAAQRVSAVMAIADFSSRERWHGFSLKELRRARKLAKEIERRQRDGGEAAA